MDDLVNESTARIETIARVAHEANRAWCWSHGDDSPRPWDEAPDWQRQSAINGVRFVLAHPNGGDSALHENWMREKVAAGWVYGDVKRPDAHPPTHPCLLPFDQLPKHQQMKDRLFSAVVLALGWWSSGSRWLAIGADDP